MYLPFKHAYCSGSSGAPSEGREAEETHSHKKADHSAYLSNHNGRSVHQTVSSSCWYCSPSVPSVGVQVGTLPQYRTCTTIMYIIILYRNDAKCETVHTYTRVMHACSMRSRKICNDWLPLLQAWPPRSAPPSVSSETDSTPLGLLWKTPHLCLVR